MTRQEWDQMEDELEPIIRQVRKICRQHGLKQLDVAAFPGTNDVCWATGYTDDASDTDADFYTLNVFDDNRTTHSQNAETYYTKS